MNWLNSRGQRPLQPSLLGGSTDLVLFRSFIIFKAFFWRGNIYLFIYLHSVICCSFGHLIYRKSKKDLKKRLWITCPAPAHWQCEWSVALRCLCFLLNNTIYTDHVLLSLIVAEDQPSAPLTFTEKLHVIKVCALVTLLQTLVSEYFCGYIIIPFDSCVQGLLKFVFPLALVYFAEYFINQGLVSSHVATFELPSDSQCGLVVLGQWQSLYYFVSIHSHNGAVSCLIISEHQLHHVWDMMWDALDHELLLSFCRLFLFP